MNYESTCVCTHFNITVTVQCLHIIFNPKLSVCFYVKPSGYGNQKTVNQVINFKTQDTEVHIK
jgi:hypothetical protein